MPSQAMLVGAVAALPLLLGAWIALKSNPSGRLVGLVAAFGAGALISAVTYELVLEAVDHGESATLAIALAAGALVYFAGSEYLQRRSASGTSGARGRALLMGAALDGIPESFILGMSVTAGAGVSVSLLLAVVVSNLPEGMASAAEMKTDPDFSDRRILAMWGTVMLVCAGAALLGAAAGSAGTGTGATAQAFAAGALLTMLTDDLIPEAREKGGLGAGLAAVSGFAVAFALHQLGGA